MLELDRLSRSYGATHALRDVTVTVPHGCVGIVGRNGSGKSTLLRILGGLIRPTTGRATLLGHDVQREHDAIRAHLGFMQERPTFPPNVTPREVLRLSARLKGVDDSAEAITEAISLAGAIPVIDRPVRTLSAGFVQRTALAEALVGSPKVLLLDEPTANLDPKARSELFSLLHNLHEKKGVGILFTTHDVEYIEGTCTHVMTLDGGQLVASGPLDAGDGARVVRALRIVTDNPSRFAAAWSREGGNALLPTTDGAFYILSPPSVEEQVRRANQAARAAGVIILELRSARPPVKEAVR